MSLFPNLTTTTTKKKKHYRPQNSFNDRAPFEAPTEAEMYERIAMAEDALAFPGERRRMFGGHEREEGGEDEDEEDEPISTSPEFRDFVRRLLRRRPSERMTLADAARHPWIVGAGGGKR